MKDKTKKNLTIIGFIVIGVVFAIAISLQFVKIPQVDILLPSETIPRDVEPNITTPSEENEIIVDIENPTTDTEQETLPPQTDKAEQKLQPNPVKPKEPDKPNLPVGTDTTNKAEQPQYNPQDIEITSEEPPPKGDGLRGFDNVVDGGANQGTLDNSMAENGNKIGIIQ